MSWTVIEMDGNGVRETRKGGTLAGDRPAEPKPKQKPKMVTWRLCVLIRTLPKNAAKRAFYRKAMWIQSSKIAAPWCALEAQTEPLETIQQLPEGERP